MEKLIEEYILAIETKDYAQFNTLTALNCMHHGEDKVQECLNEKLPLFLGTSDMKTLLRFMVDKDEKAYKELVTSLLAEIIAVLQKSGFEFGKDFSYKEVNGLPTLCIKNMHEDRIAPLYTKAAWKQCLPYIIFMEEN
tara:strand:- start:63 stop:476 length:414 start_codon:yes stop_codon:yes gene_type:complete